MTDTRSPFAGISADAHRGAWQSPRVDESASKEKLDLRVAAPQLVLGP